MTTAATIPMKWADPPTNGDMSRCACCGKPIKSTAKRFAVEVIDGGASVAAPGLGPDQNDPGYMGWFLVGTTCARRHFPGFATHFDGETFDGPPHHA